jgi:hypothetical protein
MLSISELEGKRDERADLSCSRDGAICVHFSQGAYGIERLL